MWYDGAPHQGQCEGCTITCFLRDGDRVFLTYSTTGRGNVLDMTPYGRREAWEDNPEGWPEAPQADSPVGGHGSPICWYWRSDADGVATWGPDQPARAAMDPPRRNPRGDPRPARRPPLTGLRRSPWCGLTPGTQAGSSATRG